MTLFKVTGFAILSALLIWIVMSFITQSLTTPAPRILGIESAAQSELFIPQSELDEAIEKVRARSAEANRTGNRFSLAESICKWLAIAASACITLIGGFKGRYSGNPVVGEPVDVSPMSERSVRTIAVFAAFSAICVALSAPLQSEKLASYKKADDIAELALSFRKEILEAEDAATARYHLDKMLREASR